MALGHLNINVKNKFWIPHFFYLCIPTLESGISCLSA
jgi:hypothetical protein